VTKTRFLQTMTAPALASNSPGARSADYVTLQQVPTDIAEAQAYLLRILADALACGMFGLCAGLLSEGLTRGHVNGFVVAEISAGSAGLATRLAGSHTIHEWRDWTADVAFAHRAQEQQAERQRLAWQHTASAATAVESINSQPSPDDEKINRVLVSVLAEYFSMQGRGQDMARIKLWSRRNLARRYGLAEFSRANERVREVLAPLASGWRLKPSNFDAAFISLFGMHPRDIRPGSLVRLGDNPAQGEPVFIPG